MHKMVIKMITGLESLLHVLKHLRHLNLGKKSLRRDMFVGWFQHKISACTRALAHVETQEEDSSSFLH